MKNLKLNTITLSALAALGLATLPAQAESEFRQHGAHVHGEVEFNVAQDGNELLIEIVAPGADVVGFERAPETDAEKAALKQAIEKLEQPESLFTLAANANCSVEYKSVSHTLGEGSHSDHDHHSHDDHNHDEHKHDHDDHNHDEHKHDHDDHNHDEHKHDHDHDHDHNHDHHGGHGEFTVEYHFTCDNINNLTQLETSWLEKFEQTHKISVNILTDRVQGGATLEGTTNRFDL
ncbi:zinc uptake protein ZrgA [Vibrio astriarenae]